MSTATRATTCPACKEAKAPRQYLCRGWGLLLR
jgi:hypothetical protein